MLYIILFVATSAAIKELEDKHLNDDEERFEKSLEQIQDKLETEFGDQSLTDGTGILSEIVDKNKMEINNDINTNIDKMNAVDFEEINPSTAQQERVMKLETNELTLKENS